MGRRVFFSFHYQQDLGRASQVRDRWRLSGEASIFLDSDSWDAIKRQGPATIKSWIARQMDDTSVTVVLIGEHTASRRYVKFEVERSLSEGKGILGIYIDGIRDGNGQTSARGRNPLDAFTEGVPELIFGPLRGKRIAKQMSPVFNTYDWVRDDGRTHLADWIEEAARIAGR